jgi:hypothetical protein
MNSKVDPAFWRLFNVLPPQAQQLARKSFMLWLEDPVLSFAPLQDWTVERSCSLFQFKDFSVAAAGGADFGCEEFLEGNAFG